jgi:hypothetical protein
VGERKKEREIFRAVGRKIAHQLDLPLKFIIVMSMSISGSGDEHTDCGVQSNIIFSQVFINGPFTYWA